MNDLFYENGFRVTKLLQTVDKQADYSKKCEIRNLYSIMCYIEAQIVKSQYLRKSWKGNPTLTLNISKTAWNFEKCPKGNIKCSY